MEDSDQLRNPDEETVLEHGFIVKSLGKIKISNVGLETSGINNSDWGRAGEGLAEYLYLGSFIDFFQAFQEPGQIFQDFPGL